MIVAWVYSGMTCILQKQKVMMLAQEYRQKQEQIKAMLPQLQQKFVSV
jgi:hypothetical protein